MTSECEVVVAATFLITLNNFFINFQNEDKKGLISSINRNFIKAYIKIVFKIDLSRNPLIIDHTNKSSVNKVHTPLSNNSAGSVPNYHMVLYIYIILSVISLGANSL